MSETGPDIDVASQRLLAEAAEQIQAGNLAAAVEILSLAPETAAVWHLLGLIASKSGDVEAALDFSQRACELQPSERTYWQAFHAAAVDAGNLDSAAGLEVLQKHFAIEDGSAGETPSDLARLFALAIARCVELQVAGWWNIHDLEALHTFSSGEELRRFLCTAVLRRGGDTQGYVACSEALERCGYAPDAGDRFLRRLAKVFQDGLEHIHATVIARKDGRKTAMLDLLVWGEEYLNRFLTYCLPSLLAEGNLDSLCATRHVVLLIHTDAYGEAYLRHAPLLQRAIAMGVDVRYFQLDQELLSGLGINGNCKYWHLGLTQSLGMLYAQALKADFFSLYPDIVFSKGYYSRLLDIAGRNVPAVLQASFRTLSSSMEPLLQDYLRDDIVSVEADALIALGMNCLHPAWHRLVMNRQTNPDSIPGIHVLMWELEDELRIIAPHMSAVYLSADVMRALPARYFFTLDSELDKILPLPSAAYIPTAADGLAYVEMSLPDFDMPEIPDLDPATFLRLFQLRIEADAHADFFRRPTVLPLRRRLRTDDIPPFDLVHADEQMRRIWDVIGENPCRASAEVAMRGLLSLARIRRVADADLLRKEAKRILALSMNALASNSDIERKEVKDFLLELSLDQEAALLQ